MNRPARLARYVRCFGAVAAALASVGCRSDGSAICSKLDACHLLPAGDGFDEKTCVAQAEDELGDEQRSECADCVSSHGCGDIVATCRSECAPKAPCVDADRCPDGGTE